MSSADAARQELAGLADELSPSALAVLVVVARALRVPGGAPLDEVEALHRALLQELLTERDRLHG